MNIGFENERWAKLIIDQLVRGGVRKFCLSPGSRSTPLVLAIAEHPHLESFVHFDERGMAFHALGHAKASHTPVALLVTSGTAVGNLMPAVMEASLARVPLLLLTADRPPELRDNGANQTADQVKIFGDYVRWQVDLPCPDPSLPNGYLPSTIAQAIYRASQAPQGPVQINCMFREPLFSSSSVAFPSLSAPICEPVHTVPSLSTLQSWAQMLSHQKGVMIVGSYITQREREPLYALSQKLGWPILADILSSARLEGRPNNLIPYYEWILKTTPDLKPGIILHLGDRLVSKTLQEWLFHSAPAPYFLVTDHPYRQDPKHQVTHRLQCDPMLFCEQIAPYISSEQDHGSLWKERAAEIESQLTLFFKDQTSLSEPAIFHPLCTQLSSSFSVFLSNSMPIRDAEYFLFPKQKTGPIFANRGISGIDGNIATAIGIAQGGKKPTFAILGDLACLHDLNSLAQLKKVAFPVILIVINNRGGGIFSFLPIAQKTEHFEEYVATAHTFDFESAARCFDLPYFKPKDQEEWEDLLTQRIEKPLSCLIEITTERTENRHFHQEILNSLTTQLVSCK